MLTSGVIIGGVCKSGGLVESFLERLLGGAVVAHLESRGRSELGRLSCSSKTDQYLFAGFDMK